MRSGPLVYRVQSHSQALMHGLGMHKSLGMRLHKVLTWSTAFPKRGMRVHGTRYSNAGCADANKSAIMLAIKRPV